MVKLASKLNEVQRLLEEITLQSHKHEVQYWKDAPGTDGEKLRKVLTLARDALHLIKELNE